MVNLSKSKANFVDRPLPKTYFDLIQIVGSKGKYQRNIFILFCINWFVTSMIIMQSVFLFLNPPLKCIKQGLITDQCETAICQFKNRADREQFYDHEEQIYTLSTDNPYFCEDAFTISFLHSVVFIGIFLGYLIFMYFADNYGRKFGMLLCWGVATVGLIILSSAINIYMAVIGLFLAGSGSESAIRVTMAVLTEVAEFNIRQKYSVALEIAFGAGSVLVPITYFLIQHWRYINLLLILVPAIILMLLYIFYFEETPKFLLKKSNQEALRALNKIGQINLNMKQLVTDKDIENVRGQQVEDGDQFAKKISPIDLIRFKSLRKKSIGVMTLFFLINTVYFGPIFIVESLGFNVFLSQIIVGASELISYPFAYCFVEDLPRQKLGIICFGFVSVFLAILVFLEKPKNCNGCIQSYIQLVCVFAARFTVSFYFSLFFLYATELFPMRARAIGFGIGSAVGAIGSTLAPLVFGVLISWNLSPMIYLLLCSIIAISVLFFLPETHNMPLQNQIEEVMMEKEKVKEHRGTFLSSKLASNISKKLKNK